MPSRYKRLPVARYEKYAFLMIGAIVHPEIFTYKQLMTITEKKVLLAIRDELLRTLLIENMEFYKLDYETIDSLADLGKKTIKQEDGYIPVITDIPEKPEQIPTSCQLVLLAGDQTEFTAPFRLGALMDKIARINAMTQIEDRIDLGPYILFSTDFILRPAGSAGDQDIVLTEKERDILYYLHKNRSRIIGRDELLEKVWGYGAGLETHTLETHIYRLRQKVEQDPSAPVFLVTKENGYILKG